MTTRDGEPAGGLFDVADLAKLAGEMFAAASRVTPDAAPSSMKLTTDARPESFEPPSSAPATLANLPDAPAPSSTPAFYFLDLAPPRTSPPLSTPISPRAPDAALSAPVTYAPARATPTPPSTAKPAERDRQRSPYDFSPELLPQLGLDRGQFDVEAIRRDFPILSERVNGRPLVWLDNAATTQKPQSVIDRLSDFYAHENSNIHRAAHTLAARATDAYEDAREKVRGFLKAGSAREIVFTRGATEAINLVAQSWGRQNLGPGDEIVLSWLEHHSNIVPWQQLAADKGARLRVVPIDDRGQVRLDEYQRLLGPRTRLVSLTQVSNALGTIVPVREMTSMAHRVGARVLIDGAQSVSHLPVDVQSLDCDFFVLSGHKLFAPTGIGALYGKEELLNSMPPWQGGGNMISDVTFEKTVYSPAPARFEAGTGSIGDAAGLGAAIDYLERVGLANIARYEHELMEYATGQMLAVPGLRMIGTAAEKASVLSFVFDGYRVEEVGAALAQAGIAVRAGHHCAQPALRRFGLESTVRPSLAFYNNRADVDALVCVLEQLRADRPYTSRR
jgi:cysteine desulfurase/selenocysteine lyase